ncbi:UDP-4-amino-4,6-dideoxy-N-acetyl-beta-L-altrosamine transaminase [Paucibacter sp. B51]|uniref:UDP-4-amino-4, 6-dideoxy-N-acetyl-beta-L-altrosamine transaminase n=1 Tax=Paucibacter sp. B51 TaxID=2993315 RepID=UPI0022EC0613|nr:UDP-4-amino-4,6-dideoxy-N-acetyl-beta-L-altrosamine transaminase [Paucibacter sp. B51]
MIPYGRQTISQQDIDAVVDVLRSDFLTQGPQVPAFEKAVAAACGAAHALAMNSATSALHVACMALSVGPEDRVWTSPNTFLASANCARYCGADIDFVDIDPVTYNLCADQLARKLEAAEKTGTLPKVVIPVHFAGQPCDMAAIAALADRYGFAVIEDASHAIGATYGDSLVGDCRYSDITIFSFHPVKIVTTAEGGIATCRDPALAARMASLRSHGMTRDPALMIRESEGPWYYEQIELGYNYRLTELQAALGLSQMTQLQPWIERRHALADRYDGALADLPIVRPARPAGRRSALHLYPIQVGTGASINRRSLFDGLREAGIGVNVHYIPVHLQPYYRQFGFKPGDFPVAEAYYRRAISLPLYAALGEPEQDLVVNALRSLLT